MSGAARQPFHDLANSHVPGLRTYEPGRPIEEVVRELGVFVLWSNTAGSAWLLEITESDAVQVAEAGDSLAVPIDENPETIEINWSHTFAIRDRQFYLTSYEDKQESCLDDAPAKRIKAAIKRIRKKYSEEQMSQVHIPSPEEDRSEN